MMSKCLMENSGQEGNSLSGSILLHNLNHLESCKKQNKTKEKGKKNPASFMAWYYASQFNSISKPWISVSFKRLMDEL